MKGFEKYIKGIDLNLEDDIAQAFIDIQTMSYKFIIRDTDGYLPVNININNNYYNIFKNNYNGYNYTDLRNLNCQTKDIINSIIHKDIKSIRRMKKNANRIRKEMQRLNRKGYFGIKDITNKNSAFRNFYLAIRESFIIYRNSLTEEMFKAIPDNLYIEINGKKYLIKKLFCININNNKYYIDKNIHVSKSNMRSLQYIIAQYIFNELHKR